MTLLVLALTIAAYAAAALLTRRISSALLLCAMAGCQLAALFAPLWQALFRYRYTPDWPVVLRIVGYELPWPTLLGGWMGAAVPLLMFYLLERGWLRVNYGSALLAYLVAAAWWLLAEGLASAFGWWRYESPVLLPGVTLPLLLALVWGLISLTQLSLLVVARRYSAQSLALLIPAFALLALLLGAVLGAPLAATLLLPRFGALVAPWVTQIAALGTLGLVAGGVHTAARVVSEQGRRYA